MALNRNGSPEGSISKKIVTTKGDLITATANAIPSRLAAGSNGDTLVADSAATTGLRWQSNGSAGKNSVINADCVIAQRGTAALTLSGSAQYPVDRFWSTGHSGATAQQISSISNTSFKNAVRIQRTNGNTTTSDLAFIQTFETNASIPLQGKTVTLSFWARAGANYSPSSSGLVSRVYTGTGTDQGGYGFSWTGTANPINQTNTLTTSWQRFSATGTISSSATQIQVYFFCTPTGTAGAADYFDITGIQLEQGSVATAFQTATGTIQGELAACQRYYESNYPSGVFPGGVVSATGNPHEYGASIVQVPVSAVAGTNRGRAVPMPYKQQKRVNPTLRFWDLNGNLTRYTGADNNGTFVANNRALDVFGGVNNNSTYSFNWDTVAANAADIYAGILWEASAEL